MLCAYVRTHQSRRKRGGCLGSRRRGWGRPTVAAALCRAGQLRPLLLRPRSLGSCSAAGRRVDGGAIMHTPVAGVSELFSCALCLGGVMTCASTCKCDSVSACGQDRVCPWMGAVGHGFDPEPSAADLRRRVQTDTQSTGPAASRLAGGRKDGPYDGCSLALSLAHMMRARRRCASGVLKRVATHFGAPRCRGSERHLVSGGVCVSAGRCGADLIRSEGRSQLRAMTGGSRLSQPDGGGVLALSLGVGGAVA